MTLWAVKTYPSDLDFSNAYHRDYAWEYQGHRFTWDLTLPGALYQARTDRTRIYDYGAYVADDLTQRTFKTFCENLRRQADRCDFTPTETVELAARFVQSLEYTPDSVSTEYNNYPRYPIETLVDETGDCEDSSLLLATLLHGLGFRVGLLEFESHLAVGVHLQDGPDNIEFNGTAYSYIETTDTGWAVGEVPPEYQTQSAELHSVTDAPVFHTAWQASSRPDGIKFQGSLLNTGEGTASNLSFRILFKTSNGSIRNHLRHEWTTVDPGEEVTWVETIDPYTDAALKPHWTIAIDRVVHDNGSKQAKPMR